MKNETKGTAIYIEKWNGWWWVVRAGNKSLYFGPYKNEAEANVKGPKDAE